MESEDDDRTKDSAMHQVAMKYVLLHIYVPNVTLVLVYHYLSCQCNVMM